MKKLILILLLLVGISYGQKQSLYESYPSLVHKDVMNTEYDTRFMGGVPTAITYTNGKASFNGSTSNIAYRSVNGVRTVRLPKLTLATTTQAVLTLSATHSISVSGGTISATGFSSPTIYVNGVVSSIITTAESEIVITTATAINANAITLGRISTSYLAGSVNEFDLYTRNLSASEIKNLYDGVAHKDLPANQAEVLGSEVLANNSFATASLWDADFGGWTVSGNGNAVYDDVTSPARLSQTNAQNLIAIQPNIMYKMQFTVDKQVDFYFLNYGGSIAYIPRNTYPSGINTVYFTTPSSISIGGIAIYAYDTGTLGVCTLSEISIKQVLSASTPLLIDFNSTAGQIKSSVGNVWTASNATTKRAGSIFSSSFNGTTSYISTPNVNLSGNITVVGWFKMDNFGQNNLGNILNDTKLVVRVNSTNSVLQLTRDNSTYASSATNALQAGKVYLFAATSTSAGVTNFYLADAKGSPVLTGTANQSAGTPLNGSIILIGNNSTSSPTRTFKGIIPKVQIFGSILTIQQITQAWSNKAMEIGL